MKIGFVSSFQKANLHQANRQAYAEKFNNDVPVKGPSPIAFGGDVYIGVTRPIRKEMTTLEGILSADWSNIKKEVEEEIQKKSLKISLDDMSRAIEKISEIKTSDGPQPLVTYGKWGKCSALARIIAKSDDAKANPDPWMIILKHIINNNNINGNDDYPKEEAVYAIGEIGNSEEHLKLFDNLNTPDYGYMNGKIAASKNAIKARIEESKKQ